MTVNFTFDWVCDSMSGTHLMPVINDTIYNAGRTFFNFFSDDCNFFEDVFTDLQREKYKKRYGSNTCGNLYCNITNLTMEIKK